MELKTVLPDGTVISKVVAVNEKETEILKEAFEKIKTLQREKAE